MSLKELRTSSKYIQLLNASGINNMKDFFLYFPRSYEDRTKIKTLDDIITDNSIQTIKGIIIEKKMIRTPRGKNLFEIVFKDEKQNKGFINIINNSYKAKNINKDKRYNIIGKPKLQKGHILLRNPDIISSQEKDNNQDYQTGRIFPVYSENLGIKPNRFARKTRENLDKINDVFQEYLPENILQKYGLINITEAIQNMHYPESRDKLEKSRYRIYFDKLLKIQIVSILNKQNYQNKISKNKESPDWDIVKEFIDKLPFKLTNSQKKCIKNIIEDICSGQPMMRLLQGDVGSGKTVVAACAIYYIYKKYNGQIAFLAPTEVLSHQHFLNVSKILLQFGIRTELITGSTTAKNKEKIKSNLQQGLINVIIGTTALIQEDVNFNDIKLVIIDEQHKFGVMQRANLKRHGSPHILQMTATPIPRSLALAFFGEFDVSTITELPEGRKPIHTKIVQESELKKIKQWILTKINQGQQAYIVTPLIEESENLDEVQSAIQEYERICEEYKELEGQIGLLHGKLKPKEKEEVMKNFKEGKTKLLVTTTVIEVGVDVPTATIIIIKNAERFGLSQLHQLRGRVGRSNINSYCLLATKSKSGPTYQRLKAMENYNDGFKLSEIDMQFRGSGEILGTRQSGETDIPGEILSDTLLLEKVQQAALDLLKEYPNLNGLDKLKEDINEKGEGVLV